MEVCRAAQAQRFLKSMLTGLQTGILCPLLGWGGEGSVSNAGKIKLTRHIY